MSTERVLVVDYNPNMTCLMRVSSRSCLSMAGLMVAAVI